MSWSWLSEFGSAVGVLFVDDTSGLLKSNAFSFAIPRMRGTIRWPETAQLAILKALFTDFLHYLRLLLYFGYALLWRDILGNETISCQMPHTSYNSEEP